MKSPDEVKDCNSISVVDFAMTEMLNSCCSSKEEINIVTFEELEDDDPETTNIAWLREKQPMRHDKHFESLDLSNREVKSSIPSTEPPLILELKLLPSHLKYFYLSDNNTFPVIISSSLNANKKKSLMDVLGRYKKAIGWTMHISNELVHPYARTRFCWRAATVTR